MSCSSNGQGVAGRAWTCGGWGVALEDEPDSRLGIVSERLVAEGFAAWLGVEVEGDDDWSLKDTRFFGAFFGAVRLADILGRISWDLPLANGHFHLDIDCSSLP